MLTWPYAFSRFAGASGRPYELHRGMCEHACHVRGMHAPTTPPGLARGAAGQVAGGVTDEAGVRGGGAASREDAEERIGRIFEAKAKADAIEMADLEEIWGQRDAASGARAERALAARASVRADAQRAKSQWNDEMFIRAKLAEKPHKTASQICVARIATIVRTSDARFDAGLKAWSEVTTRSGKSPTKEMEGSVDE